MVRYWLGVVSKEHVMLGVKGGFGQVCHGQAGPLKRMKKGDYLLYYSPKYKMKDSNAYQAFTAAGKISDNQVYSVEMAPNFIPYRRNITFYHPVRDCPIEFARQSPEWKKYASQLRFGHFEISKDFFNLIFQYMKIEKESLSCTTNA